MAASFLDLFPSNSSAFNVIKLGRRVRLNLMTLPVKSNGLLLFHRGFGIMDCTFKVVSTIIIRYTGRKTVQDAKLTEGTKSEEILVRWYGR